MIFISFIFSWWVFFFIRYIFLQSLHHFERRPRQINASKDVTFFCYHAVYVGTFQNKNSSPTICLFITPQMLWQKKWPTISFVFSIKFGYFRAKKKEFAFGRKCCFMIRWNIIDEFLMWSKIFKFYFNRFCYQMQWCKKSLAGRILRRFFPDLCFYWSVIDLRKKNLVFTYNKFSFDKNFKYFY